MKVTVTKNIVETAIARNIPYSFTPGEEVEVPTAVAKRWIKAGLAEPIQECAMSAPATEAAMKSCPKPRKRRA